MNKYVLLALLLLVPLVLIAAAALSVYGVQGPSDNDKSANTIGCLVGAGYGVYAVCVITWFSHPSLEISTNQHLRFESAGEVFISRDPLIME